ncbi:hypothetical protein [Psychrobacter aquaticus]|uniref:Uncharacterized protein n=1 Tax=Psychrobacter aquaticus CMS 56 TaxID=1354303 RepID=U4TBU1_9GAMM|nr:hypothetical protein [Psychrobacter aquaticus]ERL55953.1 hypothetical protein M917_1197 [Psychrobacter aquaticus CMS 56]
MSNNKGIGTDKRQYWLLSSKHWWMILTVFSHHYFPSDAEPNGTAIYMQAIMR